MLRQPRTPRQNSIEYSACRVHTANNNKKKKKPPLIGKSNLWGADLEGGGASNLTGADRGRMWIGAVRDSGANPVLGL